MMTIRQQNDNNRTTMIEQQHSGQMEREESEEGVLEEEESEEEESEEELEEEKESEETEGSWNQAIYVGSVIM